MNIYNYIDDYGMYTFEEKKLNEVDSVIFSFLSYANFADILDSKSKITLQEAGRIHLGLHKGVDRNIIAVKEGNHLLRYLKDTNRYKNCKLFHYEYVGNDEVQFGAISIEYMPKHVFVSFEGTDQLFSGWKENFMLGYQFPTKSHILATRYLNKHFTFSNKKLIIGGHSKGGNLALVASMNTNFLVKSKIEKIINADGPGLLDKEYYSIQYDRLKKKYTHIMPNYSLVGLLLKHSNDRIVSSTNKGILAHNIIYWEVEGSHFKKAPLSALSKELDQEINSWYSKYKEEDKENFVVNMELVLKKANVRSILDLKTKGKNVLKLVYETKEIDDRTQKMLIGFFTIVLKCIKDVKTEEFKQFITNFLKIDNK